jgi:hypothetical protein
MNLMSFRFFKKKKYLSKTNVKKRSALTIQEVLINYFYSYFKLSIFYIFIIIAFGFH